MTTSLPSPIIIYTDGGARGNPGPAATGYVVYSVDKQLLYQSGNYLGSTTNNVAEYQAVIQALEWVVENHPHPPLHIDFYLDSNLVVNQLKGLYKIKQNHLQQLNSQIKQLISTHQLSCTFTHIPRAQNSQADHMVNLVLDKELK